MQKNDPSVLLRKFDIWLGSVLQVQLLIRVHHRNLVPFIGYCHEGGNMALIYEYMAQGNLGIHLSGIKILQLLSIFRQLANILSTVIVIVVIIIVISMVQISTWE